MGERLNFICLGDHPLVDYRGCVHTILSQVIGQSAVPIELMRINGLTGLDTVVPWNESEKLFKLFLEPRALLVAYFAVKVRDVGRHSVTIETRQDSTVVTLSIDPRLVRAEGPSVSQILGALAGWAMSVFDDAALACGPELDLYEIGDEPSLRQVEALLSSDWRCWFAMSTRRFPKRIEPSGEVDGATPSSLPA